MQNNVFGQIIKAASVENQNLSAGMVAVGVLSGSGLCAINSGDVPFRFRRHSA